MNDIVKKLEALIQTYRDIKFRSVQNNDNQMVTYCNGAIDALASAIDKVEHDVPSLPWICYRNGRPAFLGPLQRPGV